MPFREINVRTQEQAAIELFNLVLRSTSTPDVRRAAIKIITDCDSRDDMCELKAIYDAVKHGTPYVKGLKNGVKYLTDPDGSDPEGNDYYTSPARLLEMCADGACAEDCDGHSVLNAALAMMLGFQVGLRIWKPAGGKYYEHVYAVVGYPKLSPTKAVAMDTTVDEAYVGWEPRDGSVKTIALPKQKWAGV